MTLSITLTVADIDTGPFNLYSNVDGFTDPFAELIEKSDLLNGYTSTAVPDGTVTVEVQSVNNLCTNFILLTVDATTSTTSTTITSSTTTTTTTSNVCSNCIPGTEVTIGTQTWQTCNLNVDTYRDLTPIPQATSDADWANKGASGIGAWCYYANNSANGPIYGKLYNWYAVNNTANGGLAPLGYHVPSSTEWDTLYSTVNALSPVGNTGGKMKSTCDVLWGSINVGATNQSGFTGLPGGFRNLVYNPTTGFALLGLEGNWWESTAFSSTNAWARYLRKNSGDAFRANYSKADGYSVRLIKD
jgi:uncharacterized protein (TIGR02145 family)